MNFLLSVCLAVMWNPSINVAMSVRSEEHFGWTQAPAVLLLNVLIIGIVHLLCLFLQYIVAGTICA